jgi:hypothetical protein
LSDAARASLAFVFAPLAALPPSGLRDITWDDLSPIRQYLDVVGLTRAGFANYVTVTHEQNVRRVREGDLDHLVFYALQSTHFTTQPFIEPALSAKALLDSLTPAERDRFLENGHLAVSRIAAAVRARFAAFGRALDSPGGDRRLVYFRALVTSISTDRGSRDSRLLGEYLRVMRFIYQKEFVAQRAADAADAVAALYRTRGLSTDTAIEAGYLVSAGLGILKALEPRRRIRRVLIVGPGLDLAPRTGLIEMGPPESYQPWAVIDALVALGLSRLDDLDVAAADINPRVVDHLRAARGTPPALTLVSGIPESATVTLTTEYRDYFANLGKAVGDTQAFSQRAAPGHLIKKMQVSQATARTLRAEPLDVVTERLTEPPFDLIVATNILPYFDDRQLMLALGNITAMLGPGGALLHNEPRPLLREIATAFGVPFEQSRQAVIATVRGAAPLVDSVWLHRRAL